MKIDPNAPAYPLPGDGDNRKTQPGLTIRAAMATQIMAGFASARAAELPDTIDDVADVAVDWADALIEALNGDKP